MSEQSEMGRLEAVDPTASEGAGPADAILLFEPALEARLIPEPFGALGEWRPAEAWFHVNFDWPASTFAAIRFHSW